MTNMGDRATLVKPARSIMGIRFKWVGRYDPRFPMLRLCRFMWERDKFSNKLSVALRPKLWHWRSELWDRELTILGIRVHHVKGGSRFV